MKGVLQLKRMILSVGAAMAAATRRMRAAVTQ